MKVTPDFSELRSSKKCMSPKEANAFFLVSLSHCGLPVGILYHYVNSSFSVFSGLKAHKDTYLLGNIKLSRV